MNPLDSPEADIVLRLAPIWIGAIIALNILIFNRRAAKLVSANRLTEIERRRFLRGGLVTALVVAAAGGLVQALTRERPLNNLRLPPSTLGGFLHWGLTLFAFGLWFWWLWRGSGAPLLARLAPAFGATERLEREYTADRVRRLGTLLAIALLLANTIGALMWTRMPAP